MGNPIQVGEVLRYTREKNPSVPVIDGYRNFHHVTAAPDRPRVLLEAGINVIAKVRASGRSRRPAILIRSSPWKAGTRETPWHDVFDLEHGRVRYFGDHKAGLTVPTGHTPGNKALLEAFEEHRATTAEDRAHAVPLLLFRAVSRNKRPKGYVEFCGIAVIERAEQVVQQAEADRGSFVNYVYDLAVLDLSSEDDRIDWDWIHARSDPSLSAAEGLEHAPRSWRRWVDHGHAVLPEVRRQTTRSESIDSSQRHSPADDGADALFSLSHQQSSTTPTWPRPTGTVEEPTASLLMDRLRELKVHGGPKQPGRHEPLTLLWAISGIDANRSRTVPWRQFRDEVGRLLAEFGRPGSSVTPEYPFWHLRTSNLWEVRGIPSVDSFKPRAAALDKLNPVGGLTEQVAELLSDPLVRAQAIAVLRETHLSDIDQHALLERLGLQGYESASGVPDDDADRDTETHPAPRHATTVSRIVRDTALTRRVKELHDNRCQVCGLRLRTRFGAYSEAAHIRGLGRPHHGPDSLSNLLVLCPNHHVQFDTLAIYIDTEHTVRMTSDNSRIGELRRIPDHRIDEEHLRYHRGLCGRDSEPFPISL
ncbi:HNH endonuclease [Streptomyces macrosporus]|uniref:HNH nuclease domain-containing protein n=1 Tax=Streptomyces macrosporus TaxID=44032 RepID=A0ABN3J760_9ACTN